MARGDIGRTSAYWWLAAIIVLGAALRLYAIGREALWGDEALSILVGSLPLTDLFLRPVETNPGLYFSLHGLLGVDWSPAAHRSLACLFGILTIPASYLLGAALVDRRIGLWVALLVATSSVLVEYSREARPYSLVVLLITLSAAGLAAFVDERPANRVSEWRGRWCLLFAVAGMLAIYTHVIAWFWMLPAGLIALVAQARQHGVAKAALLANLLFAAALPEAVRIMQQLLTPHIYFQWLPQPDAARFLSILTNMVVPHDVIQLIKRAGFEAAARTVALAVVAIIAAWLAAVLITRRRQLLEAASLRPLGAAIILTFAAMPLAIWVVGFFHNPMAMSRTLLPFAIGWAVVASIVARLWGGQLIIAVLAVVGLIESLSQPLARPKEAWPEVVGQIGRSNWITTIIVCPSWQTPALIHALRQRNVVVPNIIAIPAKGAMLIEPADWARSIAELTWRPATPAGRGILRVPTNIEQMRIGNTIVVESGCTGYQRDQLEQWLDVGSRERIGSYSRPGSVLAPIEVGRFRPANDRPRPLIVQRD